MNMPRAAQIARPGQEFVTELIERSPKLELLMQEDAIASMKPAESLFGYTYHAQMIPPYKPESVLILGYGMGTIAELIRRVWGSVPITGVDAVKMDWPYIENKMVVSDAYGFIKNCADQIIKQRYDYVVLDLFGDEGVPAFVFRPEFSERLKAITKTLLCINVRLQEFDNLKPYHEAGFKFHRLVPIFGNMVSFWGA